MKKNISDNSLTCLYNYKKKIYNLLTSFLHKYIILHYNKFNYPIHLNEHNINSDLSILKYIDDHQESTYILDNIIGYIDDIYLLFNYNRDFYYDTNNNILELNINNTIIYDYILLNIYDIFNISKIYKNHKIIIKLKLYKTNIIDILDQF